METLITHNTIRSYTGLYVNVFDPTPEMFRIEDIAHALSHQCRFSGHLPNFYSVAQHCVLASVRVHPDFAYDALMHDSSEAYLLDIPSPIKQHLPNYKDIENNLMKVLAKVFKFEYPLSKEVKQVDLEMLHWEWEHLMLGRPYVAYNTPDGSVLEEPEKPWNHKKAEKEFLDRYYFLT
jgi:hypothetical protein